MAALGETRLHSYSAAQLLSAIGRGYSFKPSHGSLSRTMALSAGQWKKIYYMLWGGRAKLLVKVGLGRVLTEACVLEVKGPHVLYYILFDLYGLAIAYESFASQEEPSHPSRILTSIARCRVSAP